MFARDPPGDRLLLEPAGFRLSSAADLVVAAGGLALDVVAMTKAPPPATVAALSSRASFFFGPRLLLRDMRASNGSGERTPLCTRYRTPLLNGRPKSRKWPASQGC